NSNPVNFTVENIKGINYAFFDATLGSGQFSAAYSIDTIAPIISNVIATPNNTGDGASITWKTNEFANQKIIYGLDTNSISLADSATTLDTSHSVTISSLTSSSNYYYKVYSTDSLGNQQVFPA